MIAGLGAREPKLGEEVFIAPGAWAIGDVELGDNVSVFFGAVLRGDILPIRVGARTNLQEHVMVHTSYDRTAAEIGSEVTVGHRAIIHGCRVEDLALIGMGAIVLDGAVVGEQSIIGAGAVVKENQKIPPRSLAVGIPAKVVREISDDEIAGLKDSARRYVETGRIFQSAEFSIKV